MEVMLLKKSVLLVGIVLKSFKSLLSEVHETARGQASQAVPYLSETEVFFY